MRLWHKDLVKVLPSKQLVAQWRELSAIVGSIEAKGTPNHILVNIVLDYDKRDFLDYSSMVYAVKSKIENYCGGKMSTECKNNLYEGWHDDVYLRQCFYNLEEKYMRGGILEDEWNRLELEINKLKINK